ncbi:MAG: hypothetical protein MKZ98_09780, partial [Pseudomonadales bacterium]|nr:hypothetical protein [Pseudomonadales bacterium]
MTNIERAMTLATSDRLRVSPKECAGPFSGRSSYPKIYTGLDLIATRDFWDCRLENTSYIVLFKTKVTFSCQVALSGDDDPVRVIGTEQFNSLRQRSVGELSESLRS